MSESWNWLAPRRFVRLATESQEPQPVARPCLPAVESLDDRILLSVTPAAAVDGGGQIPPGPCLVATLGGVIGQPDAASTSLLGSEIVIQKLAAASVNDPTLKLDGFKLTQELIKIDQLFYKMDEFLITGGLTSDWIQKFQTAFNAEFLKLDGIAQTINGGTVTPTAVTADATVVSGGGLLPAVQSLESQATNLELKLDGLAPGAGASFKNELVFLVLDAGFSDLSTNILNLGQDVAFDKVGPELKIDYLKIKLDEVIISGFLKLTDPDTQGQVGGFLDGANELIGLLQPPPTINPVGDTGDTLS